MTDPVPLTDRQARQLITVLRHGQGLDAAAMELGIARSRIREASMAVSSS
ncbi:hypothetical protein ABZX39_37195 [Streptomyces collinus]